MILAKRPFVPRACRLALIALAGLVAGCQSVDPAPRSVAASGAWRVVERLGDVRYLPPGSAGWSPAVAGNPLPAASRVITGVGGRVILAGAGRQVSAEPSSRFALPDGLPQHELEQSSGTLRYRIATPESEPLRVATRFLNLAASESVFEVSVGPHAAEVVVERGQLRIVT
ncbi:MAG: hypothetical protein ACREH3_05770, partial [Geminicoccales bacterium]